jgi:predicted kinase
MSERDDRAKSLTLLVVTGASCSGKTTLAKQLGDALSLPVIHRDVLKETLFDTLGWQDRAWSRALGGASYDLLFSVLEALLKADCSCLIESNFEAGRAVTRLLSLREKYGFMPVEIFCHTDVETLFKRYRHRLESGERHVGHIDHLNLDEISAGWARERHKSLGLGGQSIRVDTTRLGESGRDALVHNLRKLIPGR